MVDVSELATRLERLFVTWYPWWRGPYTAAEVAAEIAMTPLPIGVPALSAEAIDRLRAGAEPVPHPAHLDRLARFFGVDPVFLTTPDVVKVESIIVQMELLAALRDTGRRNLDGLELPPLPWTPQTYRAVAALVRQDAGREAAETITPLPRAQLVTEVATIIATTWHIGHREDAAAELRIEFDGRSLEEWARHVNRMRGWRYHIQYDPSSSKRSGGKVPVHLSDEELDEALRLAESRLVALNLAG